MDNVMSMISETKDRIRDASDNTEAMASLLHVAYEGMKTNSTGTDENIEALYAIYLLAESLCIELRDISGYIESM